MTGAEVFAMPDGMDKVRAYSALPADEKRAADRLLFTPTERLVQAAMGANFHRLTEMAETDVGQLMDLLEKDGFPPVLDLMLRIHATLILRAELTNLPTPTLHTTFGAGRFQLFAQKTVDLYKQKVASEVFGNAN